MDLGPSGPDLELDLTWDLDLSLKKGKGEKPLGYLVTKILWGVSKVP